MKIAEVKASKRIGFIVKTFGCKVNHEESETIRAALSELGLVDLSEFKGDSSEVDVKLIIINGCVVTHKAESETFRAVRRYLRLYSDAVVILTGCPVQLERDVDTAPHLDQISLKAFREGRLVLMNSYDKTRLINMLKLVSGADKLITAKAGFRARIFVKVQEGCNMRCSYCIVPYRRGRSRSRLPEDILSEVRKIYEVRCMPMEIVLVGTNLSLYGLDIGYSLESLLELLLESTHEDIRFRLTSLDPARISDRLMRLILNEYRIRPHLHLALQSASDRVLRAMRRAHTRAQLERLLNTLNSGNRTVGLTADVLIGFPTETSEDFLETVKFFESALYARSTFHRLHLFRFSPRPGTEAYELPKVDGSELDERMKVMTQLSLKLSYEFIRRRLGQVTEVVLEDRGMGYDESFIRVRLNSDKLSDIIYNCRVVKGKLVKPLMKGLNFYTATLKI